MAAHNEKLLTWGSVCPKLWSAASYFKGVNSSAHVTCFWCNLMLWHTSWEALFSGVQGFRKHNSCSLFSTNYLFLYIFLLEFDLPINIFPALMIGNFINMILKFTGFAKVSQGLSFFFINFAWIFMSTFNLHICLSARDYFLLFCFSLLFGFLLF